MNAENDFREALRMVNRRKLRSAKSIYENALREYSPLNWQLTFSYQLGALYWSEIGNGEQARSLFQKTVELVKLFEMDPRLQQDKKLLQIKANACENLMLLSLSYDEYEKRAEELEAIQPTNAILHEHRKAVRESLAFPWSSVMFASAQHYLNADLSRHHSFPYGASILQLLINRRKTFRLSRNDWRDAVLSYGAAALGIVGDCGQKMLQISKTPYPEEFTFVASDAIPLVQEYAEANPSDKRCQELLNDLIIGVEQANILNKKTTRGNDNARFWYFLFGSIGMLLGPWVITQVPDVWAILIGCLGGLLVTYFFVRINRAIK